MRIAFLTPEYVSEPKFDGGLANYLYRLTRVLLEAGHEPEIFVASQEDASATFDGVPVHRCRMSTLGGRLHRVQRRVLGRGWLSYMDTLQTAYALAGRFRQRHAEEPFDIVEASNFKATGLFLDRRCSPVVTRVSYDPPRWIIENGGRLDLDKSLMCYLHDHAIRKSAAAYGPCARLAQQLGARLGRKIAVIHPPLFLSVDPGQEDTTVWQERLSKCRYVLFFGRICRLKGVDMLARAMCPILERDSELRLVLVGRPETEEYLSEVTSCLGARSDRLIHIGRLPHPQLFPIIRNAECVVLPSRADNFPNTCVEAMGLGQLVIGTSGTGFEDLIDHEENGFLFNRNKVEDLTALIQSVLAQPPILRSRMAEKARQRIAEGGSRQAAEKLISFYSRVLGRAAGIAQVPDHA
jgi:glycosyltransferase involved in cell wall biosynthesis